MTGLEIIATVLTVACVGLANFRSTWQYPVGILGTVAFFFVVWSAGLFANAGLQVFFLFVQLYGWWYWLYGNKGEKPRITTFGWDMTAAWIVLSAAIFAFAGNFLGLLPLDGAVFGLSVFAQFLLDRKKIENWVVWAVVNVASVYLYLGAELYLLAALYAGLLINTGVAFAMWKDELDAY